MTTYTPYILRTYHRTLKYPFGRRIFSAYAARQAPYFSTLRPLITKLEPGSCDVVIPKRKAVQNHIGTVHVIAIANGLEMAMGMHAEATVPRTLRWIPKGMDLTYPAKANSDITCSATTNPADWAPGDLPVTVTARRSDGAVVVEGVIRLWISEKPQK